MSSAKTTAGVRPRPTARRPSSPTLWALYTPEGGILAAEPLRLSTGRYLIGRDLEGKAGLCVNDPRASRTHASIEVSQGGRRVLLRDESSRNGTFVGGERIEERWLEDGDVIRLADSFCLLRWMPQGNDDADVFGLLGRAPSSVALRRSVQQVAPHPITVLIVGESGTGKEVTARAIHEGSGRTGPFIAVNCAALVEQLAESELFGHVAGAFTGATGAHQGYFRAAHEGTLFLDEIGEMSSLLQPKLLRALEQGAVTPVGASRSVPCNVRIVAATNRDLHAAIEGGSFRGDLYARLAEITLSLPPLRARREDVLTLLASDWPGGATMPPLEGDLVDALLRYAWPYNVRELLAVGRELRVRGGAGGELTLDLVAHRLPLGGEMGATAVPPPQAASQPGAASEPTLTDRREPPTREELEELLRQCQGNIRAIARETGRSRMQVYRWIEQHGLHPDEFRS